MSYSMSNKFKRNYEIQLLFWKLHGLQSLLNQTSNIQAVLARKNGNNYLVTTVNTMHSINTTIVYCVK